MNAPAEFIDLPIAVARIERSPTNPRETFDEAKLAALTESIQRHGVLQPVLLRPWPATYAHAAPMPEFEIVAGERRWRAAKIAGLGSIPARVRDLTDNEVLEFQIIENLQREDLHPIEEAQGYERMMADYGYTAESLGEKIGKSKAYIYARVKLTALCHEARKAFREGKLNPSTALLIARIPTNALQVRATKEITDPNWQHEVMSVRAATDHIHNKYMLRLVEAPFSRKDPDLLKKVGSCDACPKRTGNQPPDLFEDVKSVDVCTDPDCHQEKRQAHIKKLAEEATAKGKTVIIGKAAEKMMPHGYSTVRGYTNLDDKCYEAPRDSKGQCKTYRQLLKQADVETVLIENTEKKVLVEYVPDTQLAIAMKAAGVKKDGDPYRDQQKAARAKVERERAYRDELFAQTMAAIRADYTAGNGDRRHGDMRLVATAMYKNLGFDTQARFVKTKVEGTANHETIAAYADQIPLLEGLDLQMELIEMAICGALMVNEYSLQRQPEQLIEAAKALGIDPAKVRKSLEIVHKSAAKAKKPTIPAPKAEKKGKKPAPAVSAAPLPPTEAAQAQETDAAGEAKTDGTFAIGDRVRVKNDVYGPSGHLRKCCGREGVVESVQGAYTAVRFKPGPSGLMTNFVWNELEKLAPATEAAQAHGETAAEEPAASSSVWPWPSVSQAKSDDSGQASLAERKTDEPLIEKNEKPRGKRKPAVKNDAPDLLKAVP